MEKHTIEVNSKIGRGSQQDTRDVPLVPSQSGLLSRSGNTQGLVPVVDANNHPLIPCRPMVAVKLIKSGKATPFFKKGFFAIRVNKVVESPSTPEIVFAIDPGSKRTGITVAAYDQVILNIQCNAPFWVKEKIKERRNHRISRRRRKTPYRKCRPYRSCRNRKRIPPSIKSRWSIYLRILDLLRKIIPITDVVIEDIKAVTKKGSKKWNTMFSPLEYGKNWFESGIANRYLSFYKYTGLETSDQRKYRGFKKSSSKLSERWEAHCVDSHCLAELLFGNLSPVKSMYCLNFIIFNRRELHHGFSKGGLRSHYGSTRSLSINRGTLVRHPKYNLAYVGGNSGNRITLHNIINGERLSRFIRIKDCKVLTNLRWKIKLINGNNLI